MANETAFNAAYRNLAKHTNSFAKVSEGKPTTALTENPETLAPLRMILGFTYNELSWAMKISRPGTTTSGTTLRKFERNPAPERMTAKRSEMIETIAATAGAVISRKILQVPRFHRARET